MNFILNTSIQPHFCVLTDDTGRILHRCEWKTPRDDGRFLYTFCEKYKHLFDSVTFFGMVSGPGGFSSLRVGASVLNVYGWFYQQNIHQIRADEWVQAYQKDQLDTGIIFLNSFGQNVWKVDNTKDLQSISLENFKKESHQKYCFDCIPEEKRGIHTSDFHIDSDMFFQSLWRALKQTKDQEQARPDYLVNPV